MTAYRLERYEDEWSGAEANRLIRESDGKELMSDGWVVDAPEDATLDRAYHVLVEELNRLAEYASEQRAKVNYLLTTLHEDGRLPEGHFTFPNGDTDYVPSLPWK